MSEQNSHILMGKNMKFPIRIVDRSIKWYQRIIYTRSSRRKLLISKKKRFWQICVEEVFYSNLRKIMLTVDSVFDQVSAKLAYFPIYSSDFLHLLTQAVWVDGKQTLKFLRKTNKNFLNSRGLKFACFILGHPVYRG